MTKNEKGAAIAVAIISAIAAIVVAWIGVKGDGPPVANKVPKESEATSASFPRSLDALYEPSGWMGDGELGTEYIGITRESADVGGEKKPVRRIEYKQAGVKGWAGIRWQYPPNNWGDKPGRDLRGASEVSFKAHGSQGGEIVEFIVGGITGDSLPELKMAVALEKNWKTYVINLRGRDLGNVAGGFGWVASSGENKLPLVFYVAELEVR
jgi:hypothetical protein